MGKKGGKKGAAKEAAAAAARAAEEAEFARLEAERQAQEAEEARIRAEEDAKLLEGEEERLGEETKRLDSEAEELAGFRRERAIILSNAALAARAQAEWERYLSCTPLPLPTAEANINTYESTLLAEESPQLPGTLGRCEDNEAIIKEAAQFRAQAILTGDTELAGRLDSYVARLRELSVQLMDQCTAEVLQHADELEKTEKGEYQVSGSEPSIRYGLWINVAKKPRFKSIEMPEINVTAELPKTLQLANIAVRLTQVNYDDFSKACENEYKAIGGVFTVDLLALPPPPKKLKGWTLRQVTPLTNAVQRLPYPIPPAGSDPTLAAGGAAAPPPMAVSFQLPPAMVYPNESDPQVGWWDAEEKAWKTEGISEAKVEDGVLSFSTIKLTHLALLDNRVKLFPYVKWAVWPVEGNAAETSVTRVALWTQHFAEPLELEAGVAGARLVSPHFPQLQHLHDDAQAPLDLLKKLSDAGIHLLPEDRDAPFIDVDVKDKELEEMVCTDIAMISASFYVAGSKWNSDAGSKDVLLRVCEVTDFDRTRCEDVDKVFSKEKQGVRSVLYKNKGCVFVDAMDAAEALDDSLKVHMADGRDVEGAAAVRARMEKELEPLSYSHSLLVRFKDVESPESEPDAAPRVEDPLTRCFSADPLHTECAKDLLCLLRPCSFG